MKQSFKCKIYILLAVFMIVIFLFPKNVVRAETITIGGQTYTYEKITKEHPSDKEDSGADVSEVEYELTIYSGETLGGTGLSDKDFTVNDEYGWREYEKDGNKYVVIAAATHDMLNSFDENYYVYLHWKFKHIHYFSYYQTVSFNLDGERFNGMILDSCGAAMFPQTSPWNRTPKANILDIYFGEENAVDKKGISGKKVSEVTMDGTFSSSTAKQANEKALREWWSNFISHAFISLADLMQRAMDKTVTGNECRDLTYSQSELKAGKQKVKVTVEDENGKEKEEEQDEEIDKELIKAINLRRSNFRERFFRTRNKRNSKKSTCS